jgi:hypothetical protein
MKRGRITAAKASRLTSTDQRSLEHVSARAEREQRIAHLNRKEIKQPALAAQKHVRSLLDAVDEEAALNRRQLRTLARGYASPVISLYLNFEPVPGGRAKPLLTAYHSLEHSELEARRDYIESQPRAAQEVLNLDFEEVELFLSTLEADGAKSLIVFKAGDELIRAGRLSVRVADRLTVDVDPYIAPLDAILASEHQTLVVFVEKDRAQLFVHQLGRHIEVDTLESFVPSPGADASRPGTAQRHRLTHEHWHLRGVERLAAQAFEEFDCDVLVLAGDDPEVSEFHDILPIALRTKVIGTVHPGPEWTRRDWISSVTSILEQRRADEEEAALTDLGMYGPRGMLVSGIRDVLEATVLFFVRDLYVRDDLGEPGYVCRDHNWATLEPGRCPFDSSELVPVENIVDELIEMARQHGVSVTVVRQRRDLLDPYGGVAAVEYPGISGG